MSCRPNCDVSKEISIKITNQCNFNCKFCSFFNRKNNFIFMKFDIFKNIIDLYSNKIIDIAGGEALLHPQFEEFIDYVIFNSDNHIDILTNGSLIYKIPFEKWPGKRFNVVISYNSEIIKKYKGDVDSYIIDQKNRLNKLGYIVSLASHINDNSYENSQLILQNFNKKLLRKGPTLDNNNINYWDKMFTRSGKIYYVPDGRGPTNFKQHLEWMSE